MDGHVQQTVRMGGDRVGGRTKTLVHDLDLCRQMALSVQSISEKNDGHASSRPTWVEYDPAKWTTAAVKMDIHND